MWQNNFKIALRQIRRRNILNSSVSEQGAGAGSCEHGNELLGSLTGRVSADFSRRLLVVSYLELIKLLSFFLSANLSRAGVAEVVANLMTCWLNFEVCLFI
jgi:hypothetical protein